MAITYTPNMNLTLPGVGTEYGPAWATEINGDLSVLDSHNHNPGSGVQITPTGLNINIDLSFAQNNAINLRSSRYVAQSGVLTGASDLNCSYSVGSNGELYWNDAVGHRVQITNSGNVNAGAGSITGLPSGTASVAFNSVSQTYVFQSATSTAAILDARSIIIRNGTSGSYGITLQAPTLATNYSITLPSLPSINSFLTINASGIITATSAAGLAPTLQKFTSGSGTYTTPTSPAPVYIRIKMVGGGGGGAGSGTLSTGGVGGNGGNSTFGTSLLIANGGGGGIAGTSGIGGAGGSATINSPAYGFVLVGAGGAASLNSAASGAAYSGQPGGSSFLGGGALSTYGTAGTAGTSNSGGGGSGGGTAGATSSFSGSAGGGGGGVDAIISTPAATYAYSVGAGGTAGTAGTSGYVGGAGGSGVIIVEEYYQ